MSDALNQRLRLIRFRRRRERSTFREELRIIPKWLWLTCLVLYLIGFAVGLAINLHNLRTGGEIFPDDSLRGQPFVSCAELALLITLMAVVVTVWLAMLGYVYRDAKRRGMNAGLWTLLVLILSPAYLFIGLIIYLLVREPLPYTCPQCAATVNARFNFCPSCKYNLHPACPQCQQEVGDTDRFCSNCATELRPASKPAEPAPSS